jgi:hypothetical protein
MFVLLHNAQCIARLPISIEQVSDLFWYDVYPAFVWDLLATVGRWAGWLEEDVKESIENRRFCVLNRLDRFWTWLLIMVVL